MSKVIQQQKKFKILLIGEICQDVYVLGDVNRMSPEAPVPVFKKSEKSYKNGMAGNVYDNLKNISKGTTIDFFSNDIKQIKKIRFIDKKSKYQIMRYDIENEIKPFNTDSLKSNNYDAVIISDYNKGFLTHETIVELCKVFKDTFVFVDSKRKNLSCFSNCFLKINEKEEKESRLRNKSVKPLITMGPNGCKYSGKIYPVKNVDVHDVCGAGDVFLSSLVIRWLEERDMDRAINTANNCAALSVTKLGCYTIKKEEYDNLCV